MDESHTQNTKKVRDFLEEHPVATLATADENAIPQASTIYFVLDDDFNFYFITKEETQKFKNLIANKHAALAIHEVASQRTVQVTGTAVLVKEVDKFLDIFDKIVAISAGETNSDRPPVSKLFAGDYVLFRLTPSSVRLAEYTNPDRGKLSLFEVIKPEKHPHNN